MPQYCLVKHHIVSSVIDGPDLGNDPDTLPVSGDITFYPILDRGDSVVVTAGGEEVSYFLSPISARIVTGKIFVNGEEGVKLFAGGPDTNPERIRYRAKFTSLIAGGKRFHLKDILFEAVPGGELTLSMVQPVPGKPYPGYSATIEQGITQIADAAVSYLDHIEGARDDALDQVAISSAQVEGIAQQAQSAITTVEAVKSAVVGTAQAAAGHAAESRTIRQELEDAYALSEAGQALPPRLTESSMKEAFAPGGGQQALPLTDVTLTPVELSATPLSVIEGVAYGFNAKDPDGFRMIVSSTDDGATWNPVVRTPNHLSPRGLYPLDDGEVLLGIGSYVFRSTGWGTGTINWELKITGSHASSVFVPRTVSVYGDLVAAAEYGDRGTARYAWLSQDSGNTWSQIFDINEVYSPEDRVTAHIHAIVIDKYHPGPTPRLWLTNGDTDASRGIFYSDDLGENWVRISSTEQPTVLHPIPEGVLLGTDDMEVTGMRFIDRATLEISQVWLSPDGPGMPQVALNSIEDEDTGIVYMSLRSSLPSTRGLILAYASGRAWPAWWDVEEQPGTAVFRGTLTVHGVTAGGKIMAEIAHGSGRKILWATKSRLGARDWDSKPDSGNIAKSAGDASHPLALAVGFGAKAGPGAGAIAVGRGAESPDFGGLAVGELAQAGSQATAVGRVAKALGNLSTAIGPGSETANHSALAVGTEAKATGPASSIAIGHNSSATGSGRPLAVGANAAASGSSAVAIGTVATASGGSSVALGTTSKALGVTATALGFGAQASLLWSVAVGGVAQATGEGSTALGSESVSGGVGATAAGHGATAAGNGSVAVGRLASATTLSSVAIGISATVSADGGVAIGGETSATGGTTPTAIGHGAKATGQGRPVALGAEATASGSSSLAVGTLATASGGSSVAVGGTASAVDPFGTALGFGATVIETHNNSVALGANTTSTGASQVAIGARGLTMKNVAEGQRAPSDGALIYAADGNVRVRTADAALSSQVITLRQGEAIPDPDPEDPATSITEILSYLRANGFIAT